MTIGLTKTDKLQFDSHDNLLNFNGEVAAVIHQYDRKPLVVSKIINTIYYFLYIYTYHIDELLKLFDY